MTKICPEYVVHGLAPDKPLTFTVSPVEAIPDQPSPDAESFLRVCAGVEQPETVTLRCASELGAVWQYDNGRRPQRRPR